MPVVLTVTAGPHSGKRFTFDRHDTFLVGRSKDAHLQLSYDDPYFSRRHFLVEVNPPRVRVIDLNSRNGIARNGKRVRESELSDGDELKAGHTVFRVQISKPDPDQQVTLDQPADDAPPASATVDRPVEHDPHLIPGYTLTREIGRGGMGTVYRAVRAADAAAVAVKLINPAADVSPRQVHRFVREAALLGRLSHPHITGFVGSGAVGEVIYIVMELVDGPDAARVVRKAGPLAPPVAVKLLCQALAGLAHAHKKGVVHRDVKPSNLLVGGPKGKRVTKVADFGLARVYDECKLSGLTFQGEVGGTPAYMAPEQVTHFRDVKPAADQYSAAATLYTLLTGCYPHDLPPRVSEQLAHIITEDPIPVRDRRPDLPGPLAVVVMKGLARDPADRFADVLAFRAALRPFAR